MAVTLFTKTETKSITTWDKSKIRVGDVIAYVRKPYAISWRKYRFYGIVKRVDDDVLWIISACAEPSEIDSVEEFGMLPESAHEIEYVLRNGVKPE